MKYSDDVRSSIRSLLAECKLPRDALPYTSEFESLRAKFEKERKTKVKDLEFWRMLSSIGKDGGLGSGHARKKAPRTPTLTDDEQLEVLRLMPDGIGNRDHLPYTPKFDEMHQRFVKLTGKRLTKHEFWRGVSRVAKLSRKPKPVYVSAPLGGLDPELVRFLEINNPWWRAEPMKEPERFRRWAFAEIIERLESKLASIVAIRGSRRVGKSVLQSQLVEELLLIGRPDPTSRPVDPSRILYVQFDEAPGLGALGHPIEAIVRWFEDNILKQTLNAASKAGKPAYLLFDEVQNLKNWSSQLKIVADHSDARIVVTGSSALRIGAGKDNLAGRMTTIELGPLRLTEIAGIRGIRDLPPYAPDSRLEDWKNRDFWLGLVAHGKKFGKTRDEAFRFFSELGGYPFCHSTSERDIDKIRQQLVSEVVTKTIEHDPGHRPHSPALDSAFVREVFRLACRYAGQSVGAKRFSEEIQNVVGTPIPLSRVSDALLFLTDSLLFYQIPPLELLAKRQSHPPKICICDHFVRNGVLQETLPIDPKLLKTCNEAVSTQVGHLIESIIGYFLRGVPGTEIAWFPERTSEPEIDFVLTLGTERIPVEVKYRRGHPNKSDTKGIESFCRKSAYSAPFGLVVTQTSEGPLGDWGIAIPAATFLLLK